MTTDDVFMRHCLALARIAAQHGDAPVGSVLVMDGQIIAEGIESVLQKNDPTAHAEIGAVRPACLKLKTLNLTGSVLYTNVEPCWMYSYAIRQTGISRVVFGTSHVDVGGVYSAFPVLRDRRLPMPLPQIEDGSLLNECDQLLAEFTFDDERLMQRDASINDISIQEADRRYK